MKDYLVVQSKVKIFNKDAGFNSSTDLTNALSDIMECILLKAQERAKANGRKTVTAKDV